MKRFLYFIVISLLFLVSCKNHQAKEASNFIKKAELSIGLDKYVILISPDDKNAHKEALKKATRLAKSKGFRYFKILNTKGISVSNDGVVMEREIANQNTKVGYLPKNSTQQAYQITIRMYHKKPFFGDVVDVYRYARFLETND